MAGSDTRGRSSPPLSHLCAYQAAARRLLERPIYDFIAGGADDEMTLRDNTAAWRRLRLRPRVLRGVGQVDLSCELLGARLSLPVLAAPTAFHGLVHEAGERASARGVADAGSLLTIAMAATTTVEDIMQAGGAAAGPAWFQLYIQPDRGFTRELVQRVAAAGCGALVLTVDSPVFGKRRRDLQHGFHELPQGLECVNLRDGRDGAVRPLQFDASLSWDDVDWLRAISPLPVLLKGVAHPADARLALEHGVDGLFVSNHGGRQVDTVAAASALLPAVAEEVNGRIPVIVDGGIRRGTDVLKALALGAQAVAIGRPVLWGLAVAGREGVAAVLEILRSELAAAMALSGCRNLAEVSPDILAPTRMGDRP